MYFLETSAKASDNVERLFTEIAQDLLQVRIETTNILQCTNQEPNKVERYSKTNCAG